MTLEAGSMGWEMYFLFYTLIYTLIYEENIKKKES
jgi:hypothetical protein